MVKGLRELGHKVTVVTPFNSGDKDCLTVPNAAIARGQAAVVGAAAVRPSALTALKNWLRTWLLWPDADIRWARDVVDAVKQAKVTPDWIITTSPPESTHYAGYALSQDLGAKWLAEFRDTWTLSPHRPVLERSALRRRLEQRLARKWLAQANAITAVSDFVMDELRRYAAADTPSLTIGHFSDAPRTVMALPEDRFNLVHTGGFTLSDRRRTLAPLLTVIDAAGRSDITLHLAGRLTEAELAEVKASPVDIRYLGPVPLDEARALQAGADALILYTPPNSHALPGKYAEYVMTGKPILYLGGGSWLDLVEEGVSIEPLEIGLPDSTKGQRLTGLQAKSYESAGEKISDFLATIR